MQSSPELELPSATPCASDQAVWPWQAEPYRLWSLLDMLRFHAASFSKAMSGLERAIGLLGQSLTPGGGYLRITFSEAAQEAKKALLDVESACADLPVSSTLREQVKRAITATDGYYKTPTMAVTVTTLVQELQHNMSHELQMHVFLCIPQPAADLYEGDNVAFGAAVSDEFPEAVRDIAAASRCFALDEWTACVSHLMRALEHPLQKFAARIGVTFPSPTDLENWKTVVDQMAKRIEADVKALEQQAKSHARNAELEWLGDIALQFRHFKNAWRNNVAHGRDWYDDREAKRVYDAVKGFMQTMASA